MIAERKRQKMNKFISTVIPKNADYLEICRLLDHIQKKSSSHLLGSEDVKKSLYIYDAMKGQAKTIYVSCFGGYSFEGFQFKSVCTKLILSSTGGSVSRVEAPEERFGHGSKYVIDLIEPVLGYTVPRAFFVSCNEENHVVLKSDEKT